MKKSEYLALLLVFILFESLVVIVARRENLTVLHDPLLLVVLGLAAYRGGRAIAFNYIFEWLRAPFTVTELDDSGAGMSTNPLPGGWRKVVGEMLCCPICSGTWVGLVLTSLIVLYYPFGFLISILLAVAGVAEFLHWKSERDQWQARSAREESGNYYVRTSTGSDHIHKGNGRKAKVRAVDNVKEL